MSVETLDVTSAINVVQDSYGSNKYVLNGNTTYNSNTKYSLDVGTYQITGIPTSHPLAIVDISDSNFLTYTGLTANKTIKDGEDYYTGNITIQVTGDFGKASIKCSIHGYMGGQDLLQYVIAEQEVDNVLDTSANVSYVNASIYTATSSKITKKYYKDFQGNSELFFDERVRIKSNNIFCSNSNKTIEIQHTKNDQLYIVGSKPSSGSYALYQSKDGLFWSPLLTTVFSHVRGIAYLPETEIWVACGSGSNTLAYSIDGKNWTGLGKTIFTDVAYSVAYGNGTWVAVGGNTTNTIAYSSDGITWTGVGNSIFTNCGKAIGYGNGMWIAGGQGTNTMAYSVNGINWTGLGETIFDEQCNVVKHANNMWVAGGGNDIPNTLAYSTDGLNWTGRRYNNIRYYTYGLDYANNMWLAGGGKKDEGYSGGTVRNWVLVSDSIPNWNGSFEDPVVSSFGPVNYTHNNLEIPGWSWSVPSDANSSALWGPAFGSNPWDGTPIAGSGNQQVGLRLHQSLYKTITGTLKHGSVYQLKLMAITRYGQYNQSRPSPTIKVYYNGTEIYEFTLRMMDGDLPVLIDNILFTASGNNHEIKFEHQHNEDYTMMMDDIQLFEDTYSDLDVSASDLSGITISPSVVGTVLTGTSWVLKSSTMNNWNGGFESDVLGINQFVKMGRDDPFNGVLTGWTYTTGKHSAWGPTLLNSNNSGLGNQAIIHGTQMIGLRYNQTLTKTMSDLVVGKDYKLRYQRHARVAQTNIEYRLYLENTSNILKQETVTTAASEVEANRLIEIDFTAGASQQSFTLEQLSGGDNMIWFDKFELYEDQSSGTWDNTGSVSNVEWKEISNTITNWNGSFESDTVSAGSYYIVGSTTNGSNNGPASLIGWTQEAANETYGAVLVNTHSDQMYDNSQYNGGLPSGSIIQGQQAVGLHLGTKLKKTINDLTVGTDYKLSYEVFKFDKSQGQVYYNVQLDSESTLLKLTTEITNGETSLRSIRTHTVTFKATQTSHTIIFAAASGLTWNMFFLDNVKLYERKTGQAVVFGEVSEIPSGSIGLETADDNVFDNNWTTNYDNTIMLDLDFDTVFASQGLTIALAGSAGPSTNYAPNSGPLKWHYNLDSVTGGLQSNQTLIPGIYNATYDLTLPNSTYTKALGIGAYGNTGVIVSKTFTNNTTVRVVYGYGRIDSTTGADLGGSGVGSSATIKVSGVQKDTTTEAQKTVTFDVNSGETMEIVGSLLLYAIEFFPKLYAATNTFILTGSSKSLTDINNSSIALELVGSPNFTAENGVELTGETSKYIKIPQSIMNFGAGDFSVSLWIKDAVYTSSPSTASGGWAYGGTLLSMDFNAHINSTGGFVLTTALAENDRRVYVHDQISTAKTATSNFNYGDDSGLHNYVITRKGNTIRLFIDNVEEVSYDHAPPANYPNADDTNYIGLMLWSNSPSRPLKGNITKFEVWGDAGFDTWPPPAPDTPSGDSGSGSGDSGSGTTDPNAPTNSFILTGASKSLTDVNNAGVSLELFGSPTFSETNGVQLTSSTSNYIKIPQSIMNFGADDFSLSIWMKNINYVSTHDTIFSLNWNHPGTSSGYMFFGLGGSNTKLRIIDKFLSRSSQSSNDYTQINWGSDNDLHNYVVSRKGTTMRVFEDNVEVISYDIGTYSYPNTNDENLIGVSLWSNSPDYPLEADITKFEIWNGTGYETWPPPVTSGDSGVSVDTTPIWSLISDTISDWNGGFEDDTLSSNTFVKYGHDDPFGGTITGWTYTKGTHSTWGPTLMNGNSSGYGNQGILHGSQIIGLRYQQTLTKSLSGLTAGKRYKFSYQRHNRVGQNDIQFKVYSEEETNLYLLDTVTTTSSESEENRVIEIIFIPFSTTHSFTIKQMNDGDVQSWFDKFELYEDTSGYNAGSSLNEYPPNEIQTALDNYTLNMSTSTENGSNFTVTVDGAAYGNGDYIIQTTSNGDNDAHNPKNLFDKREDSYYGTNNMFLYNWGASQANAIKYNSDGTPNSSASELVSGVKGEWVSITLPDTISLTKYYIKDRNNHASSSLSIGNASPVSWKLYGSNNGTSYTEIDSKDDDETIKNNGVMTINVSPSTGYNQYVLVITKVNNKTWFGLGEFKLFGTVLEVTTSGATSGATNSFILTGASKSLTDVNNADVSLELIGNPTFSEANGVELPGDPAKHIKIPQSIMNFGTNDFTVSIWIKDAVYGYNPGASTTIYSSWSNGVTILNMGFNAHEVSYHYFMLTTPLEANNQYLYTWDDINTPSHVNITGTNFQYGADSNLHNYVVSRKGSNFRVFVDGAEEISYAVTESSPNYFNTNDYNFIGNTLWQGVPARGLQGNVTKVEIWNGTGFDTWPSPETSSDSSTSNTLTATEWNAQYGSTVFNTVNSGYLDDSALFAAVFANNIKVIVQSWNSYLAMNWGVYVDGVLENPSFANRENSSYFTGNNAYNYEDSTLDSGNSWVAGSNSVGEWTMIKYSTPQTFTGVKITPRQSGDYTSMYISSFKLEFS